jgi:hypothetical protein
LPQISARSKALAGLGLVVAAALALRLIGIDHELPQRPDDDSLIVTQAESLRRVLADDPKAPGVEPHYPLVLAGALALWPPPAPDPVRERAAPKEYHLERASVGYRRGRLLVALLSSLAVPLTWLLARRFVDVRWAVFAAALVATSLLHLRLSQSARPHGVLATWILLALWLDLRLLERGRWRDHLLAGGATALALGSLHTGASAFLPLLAAQLACWTRERRRMLPRALAAWALVAAVGWLAYFAPLPHLGDAGLARSAGLVTLSGHEFPLAAFDGGGFARMGPMLLRCDPVLLVMGLAGLVFLAARHAATRTPASLPALVLCSWAVPYVLVLGLYNRLPARFLLPLLPLLALLSVLPLQSLAALCRARAGVLARSTPALLAAALLALPAAAGVRLAWLNARPEAALEVARWLERNADRERDLLYLNASANLPLLLREEGGGALFAAHFSVWDEYQSRLAPGSTDAHAWRTRRLIAGDPADIASLRQDESALLEILAQPPAQPVRKRFAVVARGRNWAIDRAEQAVLAAGGKPVWCFEVDREMLELHPLAADASATLAKVFAARTLGLCTVVYELPEIPADAAPGPFAELGSQR